MAESESCIRSSFETLDALTFQHVFPLTQHHRGHGAFGNVIRAAGKSAFDSFQEASLEACDLQAFQLPGISWVYDPRFTLCHDLLEQGLPREHRGHSSSEVWFSQSCQSS